MEEIKKERARIKKRSLKLIEQLIARRQTLKRRKSRRILTVKELVRLGEHLNFWIDNPDYIPQRDMAANSITS